MSAMQASDLFLLPGSLPFADHFDPGAAPWAWLPRIAEALAAFEFGEAPPLPDLPPGVTVEGPVFLHPSVKLPPFCFIRGPAYIGEGVEIRPGCYVRGNVIVGPGSVLGNSCEYKNCLLMENVETPHYNYVGDSILGNRAHLGAGAICANLRLDRRPVVIRLEGKRFETGLKKVGAFLGDGAEAGCNSVLQPGTVLGKEAAVISMPFQGYLPAGRIAVTSQAARILPRPGAVGTA